MTESTEHRAVSESPQENPREATELTDREMAASILEGLIKDLARGAKDEPPVWVATGVRWPQRELRVSLATWRTFLDLIDKTDPDVDPALEVDIHLTLGEIADLLVLAVVKAAGHQERAHPQESWIGCAHMGSLVYNVCGVLMDAVNRVAQR